jgi:DNA repair protein RadD
MGTVLRDYQRDAIDGVYQWFQTQQGNPLVVVPTGGGKSVIISELIREILQQHREERVLVVTHVKELIEQNYNALLRSWPDAPAGIYSAGLKRREARAKVVFAGVQSVYRRAEELGWFDLILIDEAHLIPANGFGMYRTLLSELRQTNADVRLIGFTATPFRTDSGRLDSGDERLFHGVAYNTSMQKLIDDGWLSKITNRGVRAQIDTTGVHTRAGEFVPGELEEAATKDGMVPAAVKELIERAGDRKGWLVFCCGLDHASMVQHELEEQGISCATVFGETPADERATIIRRYRAGEIRAIANVGVLTTGFDAPHTDVIALMRPTQSPGLYVQMVGRGMRRAEGKQDCLILDFGGNVLRHGPVDDVQVRESSGDGSGEAPAKKCPECMLIVPAAITICPECGHEFPRNEPNHETRADYESPLLANARNPIENWHVSRVVYVEHRKAGAPASHPTTLGVTYFCGFQNTVREWVCFNHPRNSFPHQKACAWWRARGGRDPVPESVDLARVRIELGEIFRPQIVIVDTTKKYPELRGVRMEVDHESAANADLSEPRGPAPVDYGDIPF